MLKTIKRTVQKQFMNKNSFEIWEINNQIQEFKPENIRAKVIIAAMGPKPLSNRGKVTPNKFFPPFCQVLAQCGISTVYVHEFESLKREIFSSNRVSTILINLVNELHDDLENYEVPVELLQKTNAVFNSPDIAKIIRDKQEANTFFSQNGVSMPSCNITKSNKIFSNTRFGSMDEVYVYEDSKNLCRDRYNTEFVDTRVQFENAVYYTAIRLMCIGSIIVQIYVYARNSCENNPSVHGIDTPRNCELLDYLYDRLIEPRLEELHLLAEKIESKLGPGFYAHDLIIDNDSGGILLCEAGFKFYTGMFSKRMMGVISNRKFQCGVLEQETYAAYAASNFITYCAKMKFI